MNQITAFLTYAVFGVPVWTILLLLLAALMFPRVRQVLFARLRNWALAKLSSPKGRAQLALVYAIASLALIATLLSGCAGSFVTNGYKTLSVSKQAYDSTLSSMGDLYRQGLIDEATKDEAIDIGKAYQFAHNEAVAALLTYQTTESAADRDKFNTRLQDSAARLSQLLTFLGPYLTKEVKK